MARQMIRDNVIPHIARLRHIQSLSQRLVFDVFEPSHKLHNSHKIAFKDVTGMDKLFKNFITK